MQEFEGLRCIYQLKGWEQSEQGTLGSELYVQVLDETIIFAAGHALISNIKGEFATNQGRKHPTSNRIGDGQVSKTINMQPRISLKSTH